MSTTASKHQNFVGGEWVDASGGETREVLNPAVRVLARGPHADQARDGEAELD